jgi:DeoR/GlpR family transcriptional regulator of sugar metabolism
VAKAVARKPDATVAELAALTGVSTRHIRRVNGARVIEPADN